MSVCRRGNEENDWKESEADEILFFFSFFDSSDLLTNATLDIQEKE